MKTPLVAPRPPGQLQLSGTARQLFIAAGFLLADFAQAQITGTWTGASNDLQWSTAGNWSGGTPGTTVLDTAIFNDALAPRNGSATVTVDGNFLLNQLTLSAGLRQSLTLSDGGMASRQLTFGGTNPMIALVSDMSATINANVMFTAAGTVSLSQDNTLVFTAGHTLNLGGFDFTVNSVPGGNVNILSTIQGGAAALVKNGTGALQLSGNNSFTGGVQLNAGTIRLGHDHALGDGTLQLGDGATPSAAVTLELVDPLRTLDNAVVWNNDLTLANRSFTSRALVLNYAGTVNLAGVRTLSLLDLTALTFGPDLVLTGTGGINATGGVQNTLTFLSGNNAFSGGFTQTISRVNVGNGATDITLGMTETGKNFLGTGDVSVSLLGRTLRLDPGAGHTLALRGGTITADWGATVDVISGSTVIDGATLSGGTNAVAGRFIFRGDTTFTNATFTHAPELEFNTAGTLTVASPGMGAGAGTLFKQGTGTLVLGPSAANFGGTALRLEQGALNLGADNQIRAGTTLFLGENTTLSTQGFDAEFGAPVSWSGTGSRFLDFGAGSSTLGFGAGSPGGAGWVRVLNWTETSDHLLFANNVGGQPWVNKVTFDGYNWSMGSEAVANGGRYEIRPKVGVFAQPNTYYWTGLANSSTGLPVANVWELPGNWDVNRYADGAGTAFVFDNRYVTAAPVLPGPVTLGSLSFVNRPSQTATTDISGGAFVFNSGTGAPATLSKSRLDVGTISSPITLVNGLVLDRAAGDLLAPHADYQRALTGAIGGTGPITVNNGSWYLVSAANSFAGNVTLNGGILRLAAGLAASDLPAGAVLTLNGGRLWGGTIQNQVVFGNSFAIGNTATIGKTAFSSATPATPLPTDLIALNQLITITGVTEGTWNAANLEINQGRDLQGTGGLLFRGTWSTITIRSFNNTFSGGYDSTANVSAGLATNAAVFGEVSTDQNFLGTGTIRQGGGTLTVTSNVAAGGIDFRNGVQLLLNGGNFASATAGAPVKLTNVQWTGNNVAGSGVLTANGDVLVGAVTVANRPNLTMNGQYTLGSLTPGTPTTLTGLYRFTKNTALTTTTISPDITQLGASEFSIGSGRLKLTRDGQITGTPSLALLATAIINSQGVANTFGKLSLTGDATIELGTAGQLTFGGITTWANTGVIPLLNVQNTSGAWNTPLDLTLGGEHVYFTTNPFSVGDLRLASIAFTGFTRGGTIVANGAQFELVPSGLQGFEWSGAGGNNNWMTAGNWFGGVPPNAVGAIGIFRDADTALSGKTIALAGNRTVGQLYFEGTSGAGFTLGNTGGNALTFDNAGAGAKLYFDGVATPTISSAAVLADAQGLLVDHRASARILALTGVVSGPGGITLRVDPTAAATAAAQRNFQLTLSGANTFTGGVEQFGGTILVGNNTALGTGRYTVHGFSGLVANATRLLTNELWLDGDLAAAVTAAGGANASTITFTGSAGGFITAGQKALTVGGNVAFDTNYVLSGPGGLTVTSLSSPAAGLSLRAQNTFTGGVVNSGVVRIGASSTVAGGVVQSGPVGTGTFTLNGWTLLDAQAVSQTVNNALLLGGATNRFGFAGTTLGAGTLTFDSVGDLQLLAGVNTFMPMGATVDFVNAITNPTSGTGSLKITHDTTLRPGVLRLSGDNSFSGGVAIAPLANGGYTSTNGLTLSLGHDHALGTGALTISGAPTIEAYGADRTIANVPTSIISDVRFSSAGGAQRLTFAGSGTTNLGNGKRIFDVAAGTTAVFGTGNNLITGAVEKTGAGELQLLAPTNVLGNVTVGTESYGLRVSRGLVSTTLQAGADMVLGAASAGNEFAYFGPGNVIVSGAGARAQIRTWQAGADTGDVFLRGSSGALVIDNGGVLELSGGGNLHLSGTQTIGGSTAGSIRILDGGRVIKDTAGTVTTLNSLIDAPLTIQAGTLRLGADNLLGSTTDLTLAGGMLDLATHSQVLGGTLTLAAASTLDLGAAPGSKIFTAGSFGTFNPGAILTIAHWDGTKSVGEGNSQFRVANYASPTTYYSNIFFDGFAPGALVIPKSGYVEIVPYGETYRWVGRDGDADWGTASNWKTFIQPNALGASAGFGDDAVETTVDLRANKTLASILFDGTANQQFVLASGNDSSLIFSYPDELKAQGAQAVWLMRGNSDVTAATAIELQTDLIVNADAGADLELQNVIFNTGGLHTLYKSGGGVLTLSNGSSTYGGGTVLNDGTLRFNADETLSAGYVNRGPIGDGSLTITGGAIEAAGADRTLSNQVIIGGSFGVSGTHALTLAYDPVAAGLSASRLGADATITVAPAASLVLGALNTLEGPGRLTKDGAGSMTVLGELQNTGGVTVNAGTLALVRANSYGTGTTIAGGVLAIGATGALSTGAVAFTGNGTLRTDATIGVANAFSLATGGTGTIDTQAFMPILSGVISGAGGLAKTGAGRLILTGNNTYTGGTTISAGILQVGNGSGTGSISGNVFNSGGLWFNRSNDLTYGGVISGTGSVVKLGGASTLTFTGDNTYTGSTTLGAGTLQLGNGGTTGSIAGNIVDNGTLVFNRSNALTHSGVVSGTGSLAKNGSGVLRLTGTNTYTGPTAVNAGTLLVNGSLATSGLTAASGSIFGGLGSVAGGVAIGDGAHLAPGDGNTTGALGVGSLTLAGGSLLDFHFGAPNVFDPDINDVVNVTGNLTLDGTLNIVDVGGFGQGVYRLFNYGGALTDNGVAFGQFPLGFNAVDFTVQTAEAGKVNLVVSSGGLVNQFWDGSHTTANGLIDGGDGTWTLAASNWTNADANANAQWAQFGFAIFQGAAGTVTLGNTVRVGGFQFATDGYLLTAGATAHTIQAEPNFIARVNANVTATVSAPLVDDLGGAATLTKTSGGILVLAGTNLYSGDTQVDGGTLQIASDANLGAASGALGLDSGTLRTTATFTSARSVTLGAGGGSFSPDTGTTLTLTAVVDGDGTLTKLDAGTLVLTADNIYTGGTTISAGTLQLGNGGTTGNVDGDIVDNGTLAFFRSNSGATPYAVTNPISGGGVIRFRGTGVINESAYVGNAISSAFSGSIIVESGARLQLTGASAGGGTSVIVQNGGSLWLEGNTTFGSPISLQGQGWRENAGQLGALRMGSNAIASGAITLTGDARIGVRNTTATISGVIGGNGYVLEKSEDGRLILTGDNTYTGGTLLSAGTLQIGAGGTTGSVTGNITDKAALVFDRSDTLAYAGVISGIGSLTQAGTGSLILTGNSTYTGGTTISTGTLQLGTGGTTGSVTGNITDDGSLVVNRSNTLTLAGTISGTGALTQVGPGTLVLTGNNTFAGTSLISQGTLQLGAGGTTGSVTGPIVDNAALVFNRSDTLTYANVISGTGSLEQLGTGTLILTGNNAHSGGTIMTGGVLQVARDENLGAAAGALIFNGNGAGAGALRFGAAFNPDPLRPVTLNNGRVGIIDTNSFNVSLGNVIGGLGALNKAGAGTLTLTNDNTYAGGTTVTAGTLQLGAGGTLGSVLGPVAVGSNLVYFHSEAATTIGNTLSGSGTVRFRGTGATNQSGYVLSANSAGLTGSVIVESGARLSLSAPTQIGSAAVTVQDLGGLLLSTGSYGNALSLGGLGWFETAGQQGALSFAGNATITGVVTLTADTRIGAALATDTGTVNGAIGDGGHTYQLEKTGAGRLILGGANTYTGATTVSEGTLLVHGTLASASVAVAAGATLGGTGVIAGPVTVAGTGHLAPGASPGMLTLGSLTLEPDAVLDYELNGDTTDIATANDLLQVNGDLTLDGLLNVSSTLPAGIAPGIYRLINYTGTWLSPEGTLQIASLPAANNPLDFYVQTAVPHQVNLANTAGLFLDIWDGGRVADHGNGRIDGGDGIWNNVTQNWTDLTGIDNGVWVDNGNAIFAGAPGTVTVDDSFGAVGFNSAQFMTLGYLITGDSLTITNSATAIRIGDGTGLGAGVDTTFDNVITGAGGIDKTDLGTLVLTAANTYTGNTRISGGALRISADNNLGAAAGALSLDTGALQTVATMSSARAVTLEAGNGRFLPASGTTLTLSGAIGGPGALVQADSGTLVLAGTNTYAGGTRINAGTLRISADANLGAATGPLALNRGTLQSTATFSSARAVTLGAGNGAFAPAGGTTLALDGVIGGSGALVKTDSGILALTAANTYTGGTLLSAGTLQLGDGGTTGSVKGNIVDHAALVFNRSDDPTYAGIVSGTGTVTKLGAGTLTFTANHTYTGGTTVTAGTLQLGAGGTTGSIAGPVTVGSALAYFRSDPEISVANALNGAGTVRFKGTGVSGESSYRLTGSNGGFAGSIVVESGARLLLTDATQAGAGSITVQDFGGLFLTSGATYANPLSLAGVGWLEGSGRLGALRLTGGATVAGAITLAANARITTDSAEDVGIISGAIGDGAGGYGLEKTGAGLLALTGASTYTGATAVSAGVLLVNGSLATTALSVADGAVLGGLGTIAGGVTVASGGHLSPGTSPGTITTGDLLLQPGAILDYELNGDGARGGPVNDLTNVNGDLTLNGTLNVSSTRPGGLGLGLYRLINYTGAFTNPAGTLDFGTLPAANNPAHLFVQTSIAHQVNLVQTSGLVLNIWDGGDTTRHDNDAIDGGDGIWDNANRNWTTLTGANNGRWNDNGIAIFAGTPGTVTVSHATGAVNFSGMQFAADGYVVTDQSLTTTTAETAIRVGDGTGPGAAFTATIAAEITGTGGIQKDDVGTLALTGANTYTGGTTVTGGTLQLGVGGATGSIVGDIVNNALLVFDRSDTATYAGAVSGTGTLEQAGAGTLVLTGASTHTGGTLISDGTLQLGAGGATGSVVGDILDNAALVFNHGVDITFANTIGGTGTMAKLGANTLSFTGNGIHTGGTTITAGTLQIGDGGTTGVITGNIADNAALAFKRSDVVFAPGVISGTGTLTQAGTGTLVLTAANTYAGGTRFNAGIIHAFADANFGAAPGPLSFDTGTLQLGASFDLASTRAVTLQAGGGTVDTNTFNTTVAGVIAGPGQLTKVGGGTLTLAAAHTYTGGTRLNGGIVQASADNNFGAAASPLSFDTGTLRLGAAFDLAPTHAVTLQAGGGAIDTNGFNSTLDGVIAGPGMLTKLGAGTLTPTATNTYTGGTFIAGGILAATANNNLGAADTPVIFSGGTLRHLAAFDTGRALLLDTPGGNIDTNGFDVTYSGSVAGPGILNKTGPGKLTFTNLLNISAGTMVSEGVLQIGDGNTTGTVATPIINNSVLVFDRSDDLLTYAGTSSGPGLFFKRGPGILTISGTNTGTGLATIEAGTLRVNGAMTNPVLITANGTLAGTGRVGPTENAGRLSPGNSIGTITIDGSYLNLRDGTVQAEGNPSGAGDRIVVNGAATLQGGMIDIRPEPGIYVAPLRYLLVDTTGGVSGTYTGILQDFAFFDVHLEYTPTQVFVVVDPLEIDNPDIAGISFNTNSIAGALDDDRPGATDDLLEFIRVISVLPTDEAGRVLNSLTGEIHPTIAGLLEEGHALLGQSITRRLAEVSGTAATGTWMRTYGVRGILEDDGNGPGAHYELRGLAAGVDRASAFGPVLGASFNYSELDADTDRYADHADARAYDAALYGSHAGEHWYWDGVLAYAWLGTTTQRQIEAGERLRRTAAAQYDGQRVAAYVETGRRSRSDRPWQLEPVGALQYTWLRQDGFTETGAGNVGLRSDAFTNTSLRSALGLRLTTALGSDRSRLTLQARASWLHEFLDEYAHYNPAFIGAPQRTAEIRGPAVNSDSFSSGLGVNLAIGQRFSLQADYDLRINSDIQIHNLTAGVRYVW